MFSFGSKSRSAFAAQQIMVSLLRTEVTAYDVETAWQRRRGNVSDVDRYTVLRLAFEFAEQRELIVLEHLESSDYCKVSDMLHHAYIAYELAERIDLEHMVVWSGEDRERSILNRTRLISAPRGWTFW